MVAADPGRKFAWQVNNGWVHWEYAFEPEGGGEVVPGRYTERLRGLDDGEQMARFVRDVRGRPAGEEENEMFKTAKKLADDFFTKFAAAVK